MAIIGVKERTTLKLELDNGMVDGRQRILSKSFNRVKTTATDEELHATAMVLVDLQNKDLLNVKRVEESSLISE